MTATEINQAIKKLESAAAHYELAAKDTTIAAQLLRQSISMPSPSKKKVTVTPEQEAKFMAGLHKRMFGKTPASIIINKK